MVVMTDSFRLLQLNFNVLENFVSFQDTDISNSRSGIKKYCPRPRIIHNLPCSFYLVNPATTNYLAALKSLSNNMPSSQRDDSSILNTEIVPQEMVIPPDKFWKEASLPEWNEMVFRRHIGEGRKYTKIAIVRMLDFRINGC